MEIEKSAPWVENDVHCPLCVADLNVDIFEWGNNQYNLMLNAVILVVEMLKIWILTEVMAVFLTYVCNKY